ncbi:MAG: TIR domain-containing protein, partial [Anaerolineae bacterium]|nr:TIR domain-containing protein [Anaerolineae bacterium]
MQLFISYKRENEAFARLVRENLLAWGYAVWMDIFDIPKGSYWPDEIDKGLRASDVIIGILSPQAVESRNVKNEWDWAIVNGRQLILLLHAQTDVPMNYVSLNYINCVGTAQSDGISQLQSALQSKPSALTAPSDLFRDYLQKLYDRINRYLGQKILATLRTDEGMPEPLRLTGASTPEAVEGLFSRQPQIDPLFAIGGIEDDPTPPDKFTDFQQALDHFKGRVLLLGEPGAGKTITLLHTARDAVVRRLQDPTQPLPILGIIPTWDADNKTPIAEWLVASDPILRNPLPMFGEGQGVGSIIQQGRALLLLDGLD